MPSALVAKLRKQPEVRDAEALAAWIGRYQKLRKAGVSNKRAMKLAGKEGGMKEGGVKKKDRTAGGSDLKKQDKKKTSGASLDGQAPTPSEKKRVSPGDPNSNRIADMMPLAAGMKVQGSNAQKRNDGTVVGVMEDGRIKVQRNDGDYYTTERRNLLIDSFDPETKRIGNELARKESRDRLAAQAGSGEKADDPVKKDREKLAGIDKKIAALEGVRLESDRVAEYFDKGRVGGSGGAVNKLNRQRERDLDKTIDNAVKLKALYEERDRLTRRIDNEDSGRNAQRKAVAQTVNERMLETWDALKPGDPVPGLQGVTVKKKNAKSIITNSGTKWTIEEITGLRSAEIKRIREKQQ